MATKVGGLFVSMAASAARITKDFKDARKAAKRSTTGMRNDFKKASKQTGIFSGNLGKLKGAAIDKANDAGLERLLIIGEKGGKIVCCNDDIPIERLLYYMEIAKKQLIDLAYSLDVDIND